MKKVLILGAGLYHARIVHCLKRDNWHVIAIDRDKDAPAGPLADEFYPVDISDSKGVLSIAAKRAVDCVMPLNEFGMRSHAYVIDKLGLPGNGPECVEAIVDKECMRNVWRTAGLSQPGFSVFTNFDGALEAIREIGFPAIIKPADSGGSGRGIMIVTALEELKSAYEFARPFARNGKIILEEFIEGTELTIEGLVCQGKHEILATSDKFKPPLKTRVATSLNYQAYLDEQTMAKVRRLVHHAVYALGLTHSATHTEVIVSNEGKPYLVEIGGRGGGGHIFSTIVEATTGLNMPALLARILSGEQPAMTPFFLKGACYRFFNPPRGRLVKIRNINKAKQLPGILDFGIVKRPGEMVGHLPNSLSRAGYVVTSGRDREEAFNRANEVEATLEFVISHTP